MAENLYPPLESFILSIDREKEKLQGGAIAILFKGQLIYQSTFGCGKGSKNPITLDTFFPLASVSKAVASVVLGYLVQKKEVCLDELMKIPYLKHKVSWKHLLSHTTGYHFSGNYMIEKGVPRHEILPKLSKLKPSHKPGETYFYSNMIFSLIEEGLNLKNKTLTAALTSFNKALGFQALKTADMNFPCNVAFPHMERNNIVKPMPFPPFYPKAAPAAAGIFASLRGLIEILKIQMGYREDICCKKVCNGFVEPYIKANIVEKWKENFKFPIAEDRTEDYYGLGWRILKSKDHKNRDMIFHSGYIGGIRAFMGYIPSLDIGMIIMVNQDTKFLVQQSLEFWKIALKEK